MKPYLRKAFYYETDQMSIVHHANYIRWMEEARLDFMRQGGLDCMDLEREEIIIPVVDVACKYIQSVHYDEQVRIFVKMTAFNGVRMAFAYRMETEDGRLAASGTSSHCFVDRQTRRPVNLNRRNPQACAAGKRLLEAET